MTILTIFEKTVLGISGAPPPFNFLDRIIQMLDSAECFTSQDSPKMSIDMGPGP